MISDTDIGNGLIDLNQASMQELVLIPGIGEVSAQKIVNIRDAGLEVNMTILAGVPNFPVGKIKEAVSNGTVVPLPLAPFVAQPDSPKMLRHQLVSSPGGGSDRLYDFLDRQRQETEALRSELEQMRMREMEKRHWEAEQRAGELQKEMEALKRSITSGIAVKGVDLIAQQIVP